MRLGERSLPEGLGKAAAMRAAASPDRSACGYRFRALGLGSGLCEVRVGGGSGYIERSAWLGGRALRIAGR